MRAVYIGVGIALVALILVFAGYNWLQKRQVEQAYATPTPGPNASAKPIQLTIGESLGAKYFTVEGSRHARGRSRSDGRRRRVRRAGVRDAARAYASFDL